MLPATDVDAPAAFDFAHGLDDVLRVTMSRIHHQHIHAFLQQASGPLEVEHADRRSDPQPAASIFRRTRKGAGSCRCP